MDENLLYLVLMIVLLGSASVGAFVWYRIWKNKKWDRG